jgi:hypothetical protein
MPIEAAARSVARASFRRVLTVTFEALGNPAFLSASITTSTVAFGERQTISRSAADILFEAAGVLLTRVPKWSG